MSDFVPIKFGIVYEDRPSLKVTFRLEAFANNFLI